MHIHMYTPSLTPCSARLTLASLNALALARLRRATARRFGLPTSLLFVLLTCTQFHLPFWMGRTLPNMFALAPGTPFSPAPLPTFSSALLPPRSPSALLTCTQSPWRTPCSSTARQTRAARSRAACTPPSRCSSSPPSSSARRSLACSSRSCCRRSSAAGQACGSSSSSDSSAGSDP
jgi:hypothetical protein